ncbi:pimeloyl-ACP methyl ester carboxylesterase [Amycolatopsis sulphurea]|uniref:Pimeloyl-ACP methyl ester carboxylesterase n=2 Tax=Amycolatopsis sulphurea TaxID=76022 RepID=A0A2A9FJL0_9PSEU|nr:alpha/beta hydrolase [Amycolatopsis sulphurea]PFG50946.1 pimeloyl-ACP methyl ester carboxylesterase [Amycolatopsis sulphurea]
MLVANGIRMHYERMPAGDSARRPPPPVVFVHGLGTDSLASFYLTLAAPVAASGVEVLAYDLRGHGRTEQPASGYRVGDFVADLCGLLDELDLRRPVHLVGNSFGGTIALSFAAQHPDRVATVVSIESEPATAVWAGKMGRTLANIMKELSREEFFDWLSATFGKHHARLARATGKRLRATTMAEEIPLGPLLDADGLAEIRCPVLSIVGSEGFQRDDPYAVGGMLPDCRTEVLPGQGHSVLVEAHRTVRGLLLDWVAGHELVDAC